MGFIDQLADSEVHYLDRLSTGRPLHNENIGGFEISVKDVLNVGFLQRGGDLPEYFRNALKTERSLPLNFFFQRVAFEPLHRDVGEAIRRPTGVNDVNDIFMLEPPDDLGFALEKFDESRVPNGQVRQKYLYGDLTFGIQVKGAINGSHPAHSNKRVEAILLSKRAAHEIVRVLQRQRGAVI
jgi:hypothetical protein